MSEVSTLALYLLLWLLLLGACRRALTATAGAPAARQLERTLKVLGRSFFWLTTLPLRLAWSLVRLRLQRGRPVLSVSTAHVTDFPIKPLDQRIDSLAFHHRRRRQR